MAEWRLVDTITDRNGRAVDVGITGGRVTLRTLGTRNGDPVELGGGLAEAFAQAFMSACWQAAQELAGTAVSSHA
jgi:hypothetical protein